MQMREAKLSEVTVILTRVKMCGLGEAGTQMLVGGQILPGLGVASQQGSQDHLWPPVMLS